jgi:hypothetical protein
MRIQSNQNSIKSNIQSQKGAYYCVPNRKNEDVVVIRFAGVEALRNAGMVPNHEPGCRGVWLFTPSQG